MPGDGLPSDRGAGLPCGILVGHPGKDHPRVAVSAGRPRSRPPGRAASDRGPGQDGGRAAALTAVHALLRPVAPDARDRALADLAAHPRARTLTLAPATWR